jgi:hypothetical protein
VFGALRRVPSRPRSTTRLVDCCGRGEILDLTDRPRDQRRVPAGAIYDLALGNHRAVHAKGIRPRGAVVEEALDFESADLVVPIALDGCVLGHAEQSPRPPLTERMAAT